MATLYDHALTTLADVKESLGITNNSQDNLIIRKINQATDMIEGYCGLDHDHHFKETTYTNEVYDGSFTDQLTLRARPLTAVSSFQTRDTSQNLDDWTTTDTENYFLDEHTGIVSGLSNLGGFYGGLRVSYTAGFNPIPADLAEACVILASYLVDNASTGSGVKRKQEGQREVEYFQPGQTKSLFEDLSLDDMLARYVRYAL